MRARRARSLRPRRRGDAGAPCRAPPSDAGGGRRAEDVAAKQGHARRVLPATDPPARSLWPTRMRSAGAGESQAARGQLSGAPYALIDAVGRAWRRRRRHAEGEIASYAQLLVGRHRAEPDPRVRVSARTSKPSADGTWERPAASMSSAPAAMGGDIAAWCAWRAFDRGPGRQRHQGRAARRRHRDAPAKLLRQHRPRQPPHRCARLASTGLMPRPRWARAFATADLVIEAVPEVLDLKRARSIAGVEPQHAAATPSSPPTRRAFRWSSCAKGLPRPERLVGVHFFNPVSRMQLVEVVGHDQGRRPRCWPAARAFLGRVDRLAGAGQERARIPGEPRADTAPAGSAW